MKLGCPDCRFAYPIEVSEDVAGWDWTCPEHGGLLEEIGKPAPARPEALQRLDDARGSLQRLAPPLVDRNVPEGVQFVMPAWGRDPDEELPITRRAFEALQAGVEERDALRDALGPIIAQLARLRGST